VLGLERDRHVEPAGGHVSAEHAAVVLLGVERQSRAPHAQLGEHPLGQLVGAGRDSDSQPAALGAGELGRHALHLGSGVDRRARRAEDDPAGVSELDACSSACEQPRAELFLQALDLLAERRLRDMEALCRATEMELLRELDERTQQPRIQRHASSL
jgi:hypothetical protein